MAAKWKWKGAVRPKCASSSGDRRDDALMRHFAHSLLHFSCCSRWAHLGKITEKQSRWCSSWKESARTSERSLWSIFTVARVHRSSFVLLKVWSRLYFWRFLTDVLPLMQWLSFILLPRWCMLLCVWAIDNGFRLPECPKAYILALVPFV